MSDRPRHPAQRGLLPAHPRHCARGVRGQPEAPDGHRRRLGGVRPAVRNSLQGTLAGGSRSRARRHEGMICQIGFGGRDPRTGQYYCFYETMAGGYGGRHSSDGPDACRRTCKTHKTPLSKRPSRTTRCASRVTALSRTPTAQGGFAADSVCAGNTSSLITNRRSRFWRIGCVTRPGAFSAAPPAKRHATRALLTEPITKSLRRRPSRLQETI